MPASEGKVTLSAAVPIELKERIQNIAAERRWTLSQTLVAFIEDCLDEWESDLLGEKTTSTPKKRSPKSVT